MAEYGLIVIGAGPGGYTAAIRAAQSGLKTALIERADVGGVCLNRGCIPTKTLMHTAHLQEALRNAEKIGLHVGDVSLDLAGVYARKDEVVSQLRSGVEGLLKADGVDLVRGMARVVDTQGEKAVEVGMHTLTADRLLIATGSSPIRLGFPGSELPGILTSDDILSLPADMQKPYPRLLIVGGGVIGVEFASIFHAFGSQITIVEAMERLLPTADREISQNLQMILKRRGVAIHTSAALQSVEQSGGQLLCRYEAKGREETVECDALLLAVGRRANTTGLFAESAGMRLDKGAIPVTDPCGNCETEIPGVYAIGDVVSGGVQLAHVASAQALNAVAAMCGEDLPMNLHIIPACVYTDPEIAMVGLTADEAKQRGIPVKTGKFVMSANGKTVIEQADRGFIKVVFHEQSGELLGAQLMCLRATDLIGELATAAANRLTCEQLSGVIRAHPTFGEAIGEAVENVEGRAIHIMPALSRR